jgi:hypothetical protein
MVEMTPEHPLARNIGYTGREPIVIEFCTVENKGHHGIERHRALRVL